MDVREHRAADLQAELRFGSRRVRLPLEELERLRVAADRAERGEPYLIENLATTSGELLAAHAEGAEGGALTVADLQGEHETASGEALRQLAREIRSILDRWESDEQLNGL